LYKLVFTREFEKRFDQIKEKEDKKRILKKILSLKTDPSIGQMLTGIDNIDYGRLYRLRVGKYRIIYAIKHETIEIIIVTVGHRKKVYDQLGR